MHRSVSIGFVALAAFLVVLGIGAIAVLGAPVAAGSDFGASGGAGTDSGGDHITTADDYAGHAVTQQSVQPTQQQYVPDSREFDSTTFEITVHENGSATWTFRYEQQLEESGNETDTNTPANFEAFAEEFESEETEFYQRFVDQATLLTERGTESTDREMEATDFERRAAVEGQINPRGVVEMSFTWHGFAVTENDTLVIGDVFQSMYLASDQSIDVQPGGDLVFEHAEPNPEYVGTTLSDANTVRWQGEHEFLAGHPRVVFTYPEGSSGGTADTSVPLLDGQTTGLLALAFALVLAAGLVLAGFWYRTRDGAADEEQGSIPPIPGFGGETSGRTDGADGTASQLDDAGTAGNSSGSPDSGTTTTTTTTSDQTESAGTAATPEPLSEGDLLTDEDRVVKLIRENGGRMKQVNIVDETGWSKSKVSMLLSEMEDDGMISKLRVGRENIISLEGFEPEATKSPFDESQ
ncbi:HTH domain protein [Natrialba magadii ATCC 43099]|uniref:HTH domain protein n=1 Tax=Natrialba magadii (strain ATCC 43099 / DSM 3394 / CCM 3739 / CIP 104546 / IAM 13178 / JCM 8861 / NBRC 102185 / NCIMB 2190 / MS3) TaxID=547559 RepID=D3SY12_NATMM|nr:hypothetical protein [Natrialba magadii]ADD04052.1 HTH domain protein [Natrialba magadii ATCC 43099]ELY33210.1 hypothetical protein C500_02739 [Natrialba magadii ATCC 43099]